MSLNIDDLKIELQNYIGQLNVTNQRVNELVGSIKTLQQLIQSQEAKAQEEDTSQ